MLMSAFPGKWCFFQEILATNKINQIMKDKGKYLYSTYPVLRIAQNALHFTDLFIQTPSQLLWKASSHAAINVQRLFIQISTTSQVLIHTAD